MLLAATLAFLGTAGAWTVQEPAPPPQDEPKAGEDELLRKLANPLAALSSLNMTLDFDYHVGPEDDGHRSALTLQSQVPLHLGQQWNLIMQTVFPLLYQEEIAPGSGTQGGIGDLTSVLYLAAVEPGRRGLIWGAGVVTRIPTGSDDLLTFGKWCVGPSVAAIRQQDDFTLGLVASQVWSVAGSGQRADIRLGTIEPRLTYQAEGLWNLTLRAPFSYDFEARQWIVPVVLAVEKLVAYQKVPITISFGVRYWAEGPDSGPHDLGFTFGLKFVFPN